MPSNSEIESDYIARSLAIIRVGNGLTADNNSDIRGLVKDLKALLATGLLNSTRRELSALLREAEALILSAYGTMESRQIEAAAELIRIESAWATKTSQFKKPVSEAGISEAVSGLLVYGSSLRDHWRKQASDLAFNLAANVRAGVSSQQPERGIMSRIFGGKQRGGVVDAAVRNVKNLTEASTLAAANFGRVAAMRANGVNALRWHAVLDSKVCPSCGERHGKLWSIDGNPIAHNIPLQMPPIHPGCRCIATPMRFKDGVPEDGGALRNKFSEWLETLSPDRQDSILGNGRADLWRAGRITTADLIGQNGLVLTLAQLRERG